LSNKSSLEDRIGEWRSHISRQHAVQAVDVDELEDHLRTQVAALGEAGLDVDEAFLVAVKRLGDLNSLSREFSLEYSERLWKQMVVPRADGGSSSIAIREAFAAVGFAVAAAVAIKVPELFGLHISGDELPDSDEDIWFYAKNFSLFVLPFVAAYFAWKRGLDRMACGYLAIPFLAGAVVMNALPFKQEGHTETLAAIHLPIALWLAAGFAYAGGRWRSHEHGMNFVRFSGEWFIYYSLIALGGGVFIGFTVFIFEAIGLDSEAFVVAWIMPCGVVGAVLIAAWLVEAKKSVIENMAPVLTLVFTPLFTALLLIFVATMAWTGNPINVEREVLIGFDLLLVLVLGLLLYAISARDPHSPRRFFDVLQFVLVVCALLVDVLALWSISARISEFGFSPNRTAALGLNLILLVNLSWSAILYARFLLKQSPIAPLERWQTTYAPVYAIWAWVVVVVFPLVFSYQ
jgi:hypothetical protein